MSASLPVYPPVEEGVEELLLVEAEAELLQVCKHYILLSKYTILSCVTFGLIVGQNVSPTLYCTYRFNSPVYHNDETLTSQCLSKAAQFVQLLHFHQQHSSSSWSSSQGPSFLLDGFNSRAIIYQLAFMDAVCNCYCIAISSCDRVGNVRFNIHVIV